MQSQPIVRQHIFRSSPLFSQQHRGMKSGQPSQKQPKPGLIIGDSLVVGNGCEEQAVISHAFCKKLSELLEADIFWSSYGIHNADIRNDYRDAVHPADTVTARYLQRARRSAERKGKAVPKVKRVRRMVGLSQDEGLPFNPRRLGLSPRGLDAAAAAPASQSAFSNSARWTRQASPCRRKAAL